MSTHKSLQNHLQQGEVLIMDGGMGTEILHRGVPTTLPLWSAEALLTHPETVQRIHEDYIKAGAQIIITDTFCTTRRAFAKQGIADKAREAAILACHLAQQAIAHVKPEHEVYIAGSMAPLEDCYSPELTPSNQELLEEHAMYAQHLKAGGIDFILIETMITLRETLASIQAARQVKMPFAVSFCTDKQGALLGGETLPDVVKAIEQYDPLFLGINCVAPSTATTALRILKSVTPKPLSAYAQGAGAPDDANGWRFTEENLLDNYVIFAKQWRDEGVQIIGGCCGTNPEYIERLYSEMA
jgi:enediyne biosynthesis protein CalE2